jgi:GrpB-like predicted nucleotidyltransferase (UPF0157 family)
MDLRNSVTLEPDPVWPDRYEAERKRVLEASGDQLLGVFHVGSTAIPEVPGKPTLDVIAVYEDDESLDAAADALTDDDAYERESDSTVVTRWGEEYAVFVKLHTRDDEKVRNQLVFKEYLCENVDARHEYARVKREAAEEHPKDLEAYTKAKSDVVSSILARARDEGYGDRLPAFV